MARYEIPKDPYGYNIYMHWYNGSPKKYPPIERLTFERMSIEEQHRAVLKEVYYNRRYKFPLSKR